MKKAKKRGFLFLKEIALGWGWVVTFRLKFFLRTYFLNCLQSSPWNNTDRRKWRKSWPLQKEVGILLGTLILNRTKIHFYLIKATILNPFFSGDRVAAIMKNLANHWNYYSQLELVYGLNYLATLLIGSMQ